MIWKSSLLFLLAALAAQAQQAPATPKPATEVAGIAVNYDESKVGSYMLPNPLQLNNGKPVPDAKTWVEKRRPEIVRLFETQQYGVAPGRPAGESFEITEKARQRSAAKQSAGR